ncbi:MAG TPA: hypothetical protein VMF09_06680 [Solirubrobacteraceae bacterium]|nr:hypothetical protein [Solirubrobacteraceae bacterium]
MKPSRLTLAALLACLASAFALAACGGSSSKHENSTAARRTGATTTSSSTTASAPATAPSTPTSPGAPNTVTVSKEGVTATLHASTHAPLVERPWPISFTVTRGGMPARASVSYEYLFGGQVVARRSHYAFDGHFSDVFHWPASAVGYPLTFRAVIGAGTVSIDLDYAVQVAR